MPVSNAIARPRGLDLDDPQVQVAVLLLAAGLAEDPAEADVFVVYAAVAARELTLLQIEEAVDAVRLTAVCAEPPAPVRKPGGGWVCRL
jgi:hypothetical protein